MFVYLKKSAILSCLMIVNTLVTGLAVPRHVSDFVPSECLNYDLRLGARLDRVCGDCYDLFRETPVYTLCRKDCFGTDYFTACIDVLRLHDEQESLLKDAVILAGGYKIFGDARK